MLKGRERVLSPSENTSYENNQGGGGSVINVFQIQAWDGKSVDTWFKQNEGRIQAITAAGIKNNNQGLRTIVQGV